MEVELQGGVETAVGGGEAARKAVVDDVERARDVDGVGDDGVYFAREEGEVDVCSACKGGGRAIGGGPCQVFFLARALVKSGVLKLTIFGYQLFRFAKRRHF